MPINGWRASAEQSRCGRPIDARARKRGLGPRSGSRGGPRLTRLASGSVDRWTALGTTSHYAIVDGSTTGAVEIEVSGPAEAELQVTAVLLGDDRPRLDLSVVKIRGENGEVCLRAANQRTARSTGRARGALLGTALAPDRAGVAGAACRGRLEAESSKRVWERSSAGRFGRAQLAADSTGGRLRDWMGRCVVKVGGCDARGRRIWAWADLDP